MTRNLEIKDLVLGGPCSCAPGRVVRWAIPPMPGLPAGEVSCRIGLDIGIHATAQHEFPANGVFARHMPAGSP